MKHADLTKYELFDCDGFAASITRIDPWFLRDYPCECCSEPAEYVLRSVWDTLGQCDVYECHECLISSALPPYAVDSLRLKYV